MKRQVFAALRVSDDVLQELSHEIQTSEINALSFKVRRRLVCTFATTSKRLLPLAVLFRAFPIVPCPLSTRILGGFHQTSLIFSETTEFWIKAESFQNIANTQVFRALTITGKYVVHKRMN